MNKSSEQWVRKWNLTPFLESDALDLNWKTHGLIFCILLSLFTLIFIHFRYFSVFNCFLSPVLSKTTKYEERKFKKSEYCEKPDVKTCSPCKEGFISFAPYDRPGPQDLSWGTWEWASPNMGMPLYGGKFSCEHVHLSDLSCLSHVFDL